MLQVLTNLLLCLGAGLLWWVGNIWYGNVKALDYLGWLASYPWYVSWVVAILPSISQLFLTEQWAAKGGKKDGEDDAIDPLSMVFAGFVAVVIDLGGPTLGFFVVTGWPFDWLTLAGAIVVASFTSVLCQHVAWMRGKATLKAITAIANKKPKQVAKMQKPAQEQPAIRLADKLQQPQMQSHANGRERANASPAKDE